MPTMTTEPQHMQALGRANEIRLTRAAKRRELHALGPREGMRAAADFLEEDPPDWAESWAFGVFLDCIPRMGRVRVRKFIAAAGFTQGAYSRRLGDMTVRQRLAMATYLRMKAGSRR